MANTSIRLKQIMKERGLRQVDVLRLAEPICKKYDVKLNKSDLSQFISGKVEPGQWKLTVLGKALGVSEAWLMGYDVPMEPSSDSLLDAAKEAVYYREFKKLTEEEKEKLLSMVQTTPENIAPLPSFIKKPRLGAIACGKPILAVEEANEFDDVPDTIECDFTLLCKGDSMTSARIFDGDIVYIRAQPQVENGEIAAVRIGDEATLKRVYYTPNSDRITLRAANPLYPDMEFEGPTLNDIEILGKAVAFTSMIK